VYSAADSGNHISRRFKYLARYFFHRVATAATRLFLPFATGGRAFGNGNFATAVRVRAAVNFAFS
jgi:hypothetical protein